MFFVFFSLQLSHETHQRHYLSIMRISVITTWLVANVRLMQKERSKWRLREDVGN